MPRLAGRAPIHLRPAAELAERVLLPGDPHRALAVAQAILEAPKMFNHARGLWGYTGTAADGRLLTVQSTGIGGPSAALVAEELIDLGARRLIRIGTCGSLGGDLALGDLVAACEVVVDDGAGAALSGPGRLTPDPELRRGLVAAGAREAVVVSTDLFYDHRPEARERLARTGGEVVEMEAAALLGVARHRGVQAAVLLTVSDLLQDGGARIGDEALESAGVRLGEVACRALSETGAE